MREPFVRPWLAKVFYGLAVLSVALAVLSIVGLLSLGFGGRAGLPGHFFAESAFLVVPWGLLQAALLAALGFITEKVAKIEWNTRPEGYVER